MTVSLVEFVDEFVAQHPDMMTSISREGLREVWNSFIGTDIPDTDAGYETFEDVFLRSVSGDEHRSLEFRVGGWIVNLTEGLLKGSIAGALLAGILALGGFPSLPAVVLPAIVPILFDMKQVRLTKSERHVLASLTLREEVRLRKHTPDALYEMLPFEIRNELSRLDFLDLLNKCHAAGVADIEKDDTVTLRSAEAPRFRVTVC